MTVSNRIAVMDHGRLAQVATPGDIYEAPASSYVARFIGDVNIFEGRVAAVADGYADIEVREGLRFKAVAAEGLTRGQEVSLALRPEKIRISLERPQDGMNAVRGKVVDVGYLGSISHYHVRLASGESVKALRANSGGTLERPLSSNDDVWLDWPADTGIVLTR